MNRTTGLAFALCLLAMQPGAALAYIGPGMAGGALAAVIGVLGAIVLAIFAVLWYPIKRMINGKKVKPGADKGKAG